MMDQLEKAPKWFLLCVIIALGGYIAWSNHEIRVAQQEMQATLAAQEREATAQRERLIAVKDQIEDLKDRRRR